MKKQLTAVLALCGSMSLAQAGGSECDKKHCPIQNETPATSAAASDLDTVDAITNDVPTDQEECRCPHCPHCGKNTSRNFFDDDPFFSLNTDIFDAALHEMERAQKHINTIMHNRQTNEPEKQITVEIKDEDPAVLEIIIALPGFEEKDIAVNISSNDKEKVKTLEVTAKKAADTKKDDDKNGKNKKSKSSRMSTSYSSYQSYVNGRQVNKSASAYTYSDGCFKWNMLLPSDVVADDNYSMSFKEGKLLIKFNRKNNDQQVKKLEFKKEDK